MDGWAYYTIQEVYRDSCTPEAIRTSYPYIKKHAS